MYVHAHTAVSYKGYHIHTEIKKKGLTSFAKNIEHLVCFDKAKLYLSTGLHCIENGAEEMRSFMNHILLQREAGATVPQETISCKYKTCCTHSLLESSCTRQTEAIITGTDNANLAFLLFPTISYNSLLWFPCFLRLTLSLQFQSYYFFLSQLSFKPRQV